jgi:hypothetical protein
MSENMTVWNKVKQPPSSALKQIQAGRLKGKTDINPQWRYQALTELYGPCGIGWKYEIARLWNEPGPDGQVFAFAEVRLYTRNGEGWSDPIPGAGGSMLVDKESRGLHASDEGYKMAITDGLSVACKMLGIAADVYAGLWDGSKYNTPINSNGFITQHQAKQIEKMIEDTKSDKELFLKYCQASSIEEIQSSMFSRVIAALQRKANGGK